MKLENRRRPGRQALCTCPPLRSPQGDLRGSHVHFAGAEALKEGDKLENVPKRGEPDGGWARNISLSISLDTFVPIPAEQAASRNTRVM